MTASMAAIYATDNPVIVTHGGIRWQCVGGVQAEIFAAAAPTWANPEKDNRFQMVKANPARRIYRITFRDQEYYLKIYQPADFLGRVKWLLQRPPAQREFTHLRTAARRHVPVPVPIAWGEGKINGRRAAALITPSLGAVASLEDLVWSENPAKPQFLPDILSAAGAAIARLHCAGIVHHDLHAGNILIENACSDGPKNAYVTDLQSVTIQPRSGHASADPMHKDRQANLAVIIAALRHKLPQSTIKHLVEGYLNTIQPHQVMSDDKLQNYYLKLMTLARRHDARVMRARERRCLRNSRYARHIKLSDGWSAQVYLQYRYPKDEYLASRLTFTVDDWRNALAKPERLLTEGTVIKQGGHNTVREMELQIGSHSIPIIIKHTRVRSGLRGFWQALRRSRAMRQWLWAHALIMRDIPTAWPLAAMEHFRWGFIFESIFITEKIPDSQNLKLTLLENQNLPQKSRQRYDLCRKLGEILRNLDQFGLNHRDCKVSNILIQKTQDKQDNILWLPYLIDLDGLSRLYWLRYFRHYQTIIRLAASSLELDNITNRDRVAVFSGYILQNLQTKRVFRHPNSERERQLWRYLSRQARKRSGLEN